MVDPKYVRACGLAVLTIAVMAIGVAAGRAETPSFVAPPRTIADITAILEQEKPDPQRFAKLQADASAQPPAGADRQAVARFLYGRADARSTLGRVGDAIGDLEVALEYARAEHMDAFAVRIQTLLGFVHGWAGEQQRSLEAFRAVERDTRNEPLALVRYNAVRWIGINLIQLGDLEKA